MTRISAAAARDNVSGGRLYLITGDMADLDDQRLVPGIPVEVFVQTTAFRADCPHFGGKRRV